MRRPILIILFLECLVIIVLINGLGLQLYKTELAPYYDSVQTISGIVKTVQIKKNYTAMTIDAGRENILLRLKNVSDEDYIFDMTGRKITATGMITEPSGQRNPGCFDYRNYLRARKCYSIIEVSKFKFEPGIIVNHFSHYLSVQKGLFFKASKNMISENNFSVLSGVLFGEKGYMDDDLYKEFQTNGIAHVLAVSGLHVGLVYGVIQKLLKRKDLVTSIIGLFCLFVYAALSNFAISVIRAAVMIALSIIAFQIKRKYDMLSAASAVAIVILIINPYYLYDSGAQLSFLAAYSLAVLLPWFETRFKALCDKKKNERLYKIGQIFIPGVVLQIGMTPLMIYQYSNFSPLSLFINPLAIYFASLLLPAGLLCFLLYPFKILFAASSGVAQSICFLLTTLSRLADKILPGLTIKAPPFSLIALYYLLLFFYFSEARFILIRKHKDDIVIMANCGLIITACVLPVFLGISQSFIPWQYNHYDYVFLDVGQGDSAHVYSDGLNMLIDGGGSYYKDIANDTLKPYLLKNGVSHLDLAIVSHMDLDHSKGIADLSKEMKIDTIVLPISAKGKDVSEFNCNNILYLAAGDTIKFGDTTLTIISANGPDENAGSLVCLCDGPSTDALFMADAPIDTENNLTFPKADILKVGHHGSKTSTSERLLEQSTPQIAIISCGKNNRYGHPTDRVLELLENYGIIIKRIDFEGAICIKNKSILTK